MSNNISSIFTDINNLPLNNNEKANLFIFFTGRDMTEVKIVLSIITEDKVKIDYLRKYVNSKGKHLRHNW
jgi:hypothetical protein